MPSQANSTAGSGSGEADVIQSAALSGHVFGARPASHSRTSAGRGTMTLTVFGTSTTTSQLRVLHCQFEHSVHARTDATVLGQGRAEKQSGGPFTTGSLSGKFTFGSTGDTLNNVGGVNTAGTLTISGGSIGNGAYDSVADGNPTLNQAFSGTVNSVDSNGRVSVSLTPSGPGNPINEVWYLVSPTRGFSLVFYPNNPRNHRGWHDRPAGQRAVLDRKPEGAVRILHAGIV